MRMKNQAIAVLLTSSILLLSACATNGGGGAAAGTSGANNESKSSNGQKITLVFQHIEVDVSTPRYKVTRKITDDFMAKYPNIQIEWDAVNNDQQKAKLKTQAASGEMPDITTIGTNAQLKPYVDAGLLAPLDDILPEIKDIYPAGLLQYNSINNKLYGLPILNNVGAIFYNKKVFTDNGVQPPKTYEELVDVSKKLKAKGITPIAIGEKDTWTGSMLLGNILLKLNGPGYVKDVMDGKKKFTDAPFVQAIDKLQDLIQAGAFQDGATSIDNNTAKSLFKTNKTAMIYMGTWATGEFSDALKDDLGVFKFPTVEGKGNPEEYILAPGGGFSLAQNGKHLKEAKEFLKYFMTNYAAVSLENKNAVGLAMKVTGDLKAAGYNNTQIEVNELLKSVKGGDMTFDSTMDPATTQTHLSVLQKVFVQKVKSTDIAKAHQDAFDSNNKK